MKHEKLIYDAEESTQYTSMHGVCEIEECIYKQ